MECRTLHERCIHQRSETRLLAHHIDGFHWRIQIADSDPSQSFIPCCPVFLQGSAGMHAIRRGAGTEIPKTLNWYDVILKPYVLLFFHSFLDVDFQLLNRLIGLHEFGVQFHRHAEMIDCLPEHRVIIFISSPSGEVYGAVKP